MPIRNSHPVTFRWKTLSDAIDSSNLGKGCAAILQNLVPSLHTRGIFALRPAARKIAAFLDGGFIAPIGQGELLFISGSRIYGLIQTGRFAGHSEPFCWDTASSSFIPISGVTSANTPVSTSNTGDWTPPTATEFPTKIIMTHPGFPGGATKFGWIDTTNLNALTWSAGDLGTHPLVDVPTAVAQFNGRAWYAVGNALAFSDAGSPLVASYATAVQVITFYNDLHITALATQPLTTLTGGVVGALLVFQGATAIQQITGDAAFGTLAVNELTSQTGTIGPNSIAQTPYGTLFVAHDGVRMVSLSGNISPPLASEGTGVQIPFINAPSPTRIAATYQEDAYSITVPLALGATVSYREFRYSLNEKVWTGPHTFPAALIQPSQTDQSFYLFAPDTSGGIWQMEVLPTINSQYTEAGQPLAYLAATCLLPDNDLMSTNAVVESALMLSLPSGQTATVSAYNELGQQLGIATLHGQTGGVVFSDFVATGGALWGQATWGSAKWGPTTGAFVQLRIPWPNALVFKQAQFAISGSSSQPVAIGNLYIKYQPLGYMGTPNVAA